MCDPEGFRQVLRLRNPIGIAAAAFQFFELPFFTGNIGSLIATVPEATRIELKRSSAALFTHEDVIMYLK